MLPFYYYEVGKLLLAECANDFQKPQETSSILEDIKEIRKEKLLHLMRDIDADTPVKYLSHVGS